MTTFYNITLKGLYITYVGGRGPEDFYGGHEIFQKCIDGVGAQNIQTSHQGDLTKTRHVNKSHPFSRYKANSGKNKKKIV